MLGILGGITLLAIHDALLAAALRKHDTAGR